MNKVFWGIGAICMLGLTACGGSDSMKDDPIFMEPEPPEIEQPYVRVVFNPAMNDLNIPNDLLMIPSGNFFDFTLNTEGSDPFNGANPQHALSGLDGWSIHHPMVIRVETPDGMDIDPATVGGDSIQLFEATQALEGSSDKCLEIASVLAAPGAACELGEPLVYGEDYFASYTAGTNSISLVPLKVLKASQGYILVVTESLKDLNGRVVKGSGTWDLVRQNILTNQVGAEALVPVQQLVNFMVDVLEPAGIPREELSYAAYFSTQSVGNDLHTIKKLNISPFAQALQQSLESGSDLAQAQMFAAQFLPSIVTELPENAPNSFEVLAPLVLGEQQLDALTAVGLNTCLGLMTALAEPQSPLFGTAAETFALVGPLCAASRVLGEVNLPYYLDPHAPKTGRWKAACTSGATLNSIGAENVGALIAAGQVGENNALCQLASNNQLLDLDLSSLGMTDPRNITKYNPIPMVMGRQSDNPETMYNEAGTEIVNVHFTVPNESVIAAISAASNGNIPVITKPASGWPVIMFMHGITGNKQNVLPLTAAFSLAGFATVAIDHPLHGDRGLEALDNTIANASTESIADYLNFASLLTARDNTKQSSVDIVSLRLALNAIVDTTGLIDFDTSKVHFISHSLGSVTGTVALSVANQTLGEELAAFDDMYAIKTAVLNVPASGIAYSILESPDFGPLVRGSLLKGSSAEFKLFLENYASTNNMQLEAATRPAYNAFIALLDEAQLAEVNATLASFGFAAQTVLDSTDPIGFAKTTGENTSVLMHLLLGGGTNDDGNVAISDPVNPLLTSIPLAGSQALSSLMGLTQISQTAENGGVVRLLTGDHFSMFTPEASAATTLEVQSQAVSFFLSEGNSVVISNESIVEN